MPADISVYPASYYIDVTNDGIKDLLLTTNTNNNSETLKVVGCLKIQTQQIHQTLTSLKKVFYKMK